MLLCDWQIRDLVEQLGMIEPFVGQQVREENGRKILSYGLTSYGYDVRLSNIFKVFNNRVGDLIDPLRFNEQILTVEEADCCVIAPNSYILGNTIEYFNFPRNIVADCVGKSTYARCGLIINVTPAEPEWCGHLTLELCNGTPLPIKVYAGMGVAQMRFFRGENPHISYADRQGKYQDQEAMPVSARL